MTVDRVTISVLTAEDAGELLTLQRAAYATEAQLYREPALPPLTQTLDELRDELAASLTLKATLGHRIVGAVRGRREQETLHIGRLMVAPDLHGRGIGSRLLTEIERRTAGTVERYVLFTGHLSAGNLRFYHRRGYGEVGREELLPGVIAVRLVKPAEARR